MWSIDCIFINLFDYEYSINELLILCLKHLILKFALSFLIYNVYVIWFEIIWNYIRGNLIYCILSAKIDQLINILNEFAKGSDHKIDFVTLQKSKTRFQIPASNNFNEFIDQLYNIGSFTNFVFET